MASNNKEFQNVDLEPTTAQCNCGAVKLKLNNPQLTMACHCHDCRARTGAPAAFCVTSKGSDVEVEAEDGQVVTFGKFHPDGSNKGPRVNFCKTCGTNTHYTSFSGAVVQVPYCLTELRMTIQEPAFHLWKDSSVPCSAGMLESANVPVFDGMPSGPAMDTFMSIIKG